MKNTEEIPVTCIKDGVITQKKDLVVAEKAFAIYLDGEKLIESTCTPGNYKELVYGYLFSEGIIGAVDEVASVQSASDGFRVELAETVDSVTSRGSGLVESDFTFPAERFIDVAREVHSRGKIFRSTGGTHAVAVGDGSGLVAFFEDISRTCALEKLLGDALLRGISLGNKFIFLSSRIPKRMLLKIARCGIPIAAGVSAPTADVVEEAKRLGICICGFVREKRMNVYSHRWRVGL